MKSLSQLWPELSFAQHQEFSEKIDPFEKNKKKSIFCKKFRNIPKCNEHFRFFAVINYVRVDLSTKN